MSFFFFSKTGAEQGTCAFHETLRSSFSLCVGLENESNTCVLWIHCLFLAENEKPLMICCIFRCRIHVVQTKGSPNYIAATLI